MLAGYIVFHFVNRVNIKTSLIAKMYDNLKNNNVMNGVFDILSISFMRKTIFKRYFVIVFDIKLRILTDFFPG